MRVIAGHFKGRLLKTAAGQHTRPTTDKIKESIFQRIGPFFDGGDCLDLFAGSGSLGIEALSRGLDSAVFVDNNRQAIRIIRHNLQILKIEKNRATVLSMDAFRALRFLARQNRVFTHIFLDPPYEQIDFEQLLQDIDHYKLLKSDGLILCEHQINEKLPSNIGCLTLFKQYTYGKTTGITLYKLT